MLISVITFGSIQTSQTWDQPYGIYVWTVQLSARRSSKNEPLNLIPVQVRRTRQFSELTWIRRVRSAKAWKIESRSFQVSFSLRRRNHHHHHRKEQHLRYCPNPIWFTSLFLLLALHLPWSNKVIRKHSLTYFVRGSTYHCTADLIFDWFGFDRIGWLNKIT